MEGGSDPDRAEVIADRVTELLDCATENLKLPTFWQCLWQRIKLFIEVSQELEIIAIGLSRFHHDDRLALERMLRRSGE
jgi:hypothetical protein